MSTFSGLSTALTGLYASRQGLDLAGQNIANANTEGYSRQRMTLNSIGAPTTPAFFSTYDGVGSGVGVAGIARLRDSFLEQRGHTEHGRTALLQTNARVLANIEDVVAPPGDTGLQAQLAEYWNSWHDLANRPGDGAARSQLMQRAATLTDGLHQADAALETQWKSHLAELQTLVEQVNTTAGNLAELNVAITRNTQAGMPASELIDQRDVLVMQLADLVGATTKPGADGALDVFIGGSALVRGSTTQKVEVTGATTFAQTRTLPPTPVGMTWPSGYPIAVEVGKAAGLAKALNTTLPGYADRLDEVALELATGVNALHSAGYGRDGVSGRDFFSGTTARDIRVALTSNEQIAASAIPGTVLEPDQLPGDTPRAPFDGSQAARVADLAKSTAGADALFRKVVVDLGIETQTTNRRVEIQGNITAQVDASRESQAGVDLDEEMTSMLTFQRAYEGAARVMTAIDSALDTLINRTGIVGR